MKPLSYWESEGGVLFCSELRSLAAFRPSRLEISPGSVMQYLAFGYVPDPSTIFEGVRKLPPAHYLLWSAEAGTSIHRYWSPARPEAGPSDEQEFVEQLKVRLDSAVASHLESEVPLGAFLSGGLDSSTVVALMTRHAQGRVRTFSIGFSEPSFDESAIARRVAGSFGTEHTELIVTPNVDEMFESVAGMFDEPFADASAIPTFLVAQLARTSVTVALSGDGGDELFGGYTRYGEMLRKGEHLQPMFGRAAASVGAVLPHFAPGRNKLLNAGRSRWGQYAATVVEATRIEEGGVARADSPDGSILLGQRLAGFEPEGFGDDFAAAMMDVDLHTYLPGDILTKVDRTSMAVSLEARVPLLDFDLIDFALRVPGHLRVNATESKRMFRRAIAELVPAFVLSRPKQGFGIPLGRWFRGPLRHRLESLQVVSPSLQPFVDGGAVRRLVREHLLGRRDHHVMLWRLMVLERWLRMLDCGGLARPPVLPHLRVRE
jgi:asparagine synthase (glutamine-hydrolysing)